MARRPEQYYFHFRKYINGHMENCRAEIETKLSHGEIGRLHELEPEIEDILGWQLKVLKAYQWHRKPAWLFACLVWSAALSGRWWALSGP